MQVLILGCGYVGTAFGSRLLAQGAFVQGTCRSQNSAAALRAKGISPIMFDGVACTTLIEATKLADVILASIPPTDKGDLSFNALADVLPDADYKWIGYLSTTGVYGDRQGGWAFEDDKPTPASVVAKRRVDAERVWQAPPRAAHVFRLPGIYGPGRSALDQVRAGTARRIDKAGQVFSRAHRKDIVDALIASVGKPNLGRIYNLCDDKPCASGEVVVEACRLLGVSVPPLTPFADASNSKPTTY